MYEGYLFIACLLLASVVVGAVRVFWDYGRVERLLILQLLGTTLVAVVLLLAQALQHPGLFDLALVIGLLAAILAVAFVRGGLIHSKERRKP